MIEFNGCISGAAEKFFWKNSRNIALKIYLASLLIVLPIFVIISVGSKNWIFLSAYGAFCILTTPLFFVPKTKKEKEVYKTSKIFTDDEYIVYCANKYEEYKLIADASKLIDYGDFYFISFHFGKKSDKFVCQKNLLTKGTLEEFEALFEGKIERRTK